MSGCCSRSRSVVVEVTVLRVDGETCDRCGNTVDAVRQAVKELQEELSPFSVPVTLVEHAGDGSDIAGSNTVRINGKPLEELIGAVRVESECPSCSDLLGEEGVCCGAIAVGEETQESFTKEQVKEAALAELGLAGGCGCS